MRVGDAGELAVIRALRQIFDAPRPDLPVANGDDAAVWLPDGPVVLTVDSVVAGVDWLPDRTPPEAIGHRAAAVNLSDLAAMGARPRVLLLALELPPEHALDQLLASARGLRALADRHGATVVGGDLGFSAGPARWTVTALGTLAGPPLRRDAVQPGDRLWLLGDVGRAALGLRALQAGAKLADLVTAHLYPQPLVTQGQALQARGVHAAIDISDGLGLDARRLAEASGVSLQIDVPRPVWLTDALARQLDALHWDWRTAMAGGGDDYALLCAAQPDLDLTDLGAIAVGYARIGPADVALRIDGVPCPIAGFHHGDPGSAGNPREMS